MAENKPDWYECGVSKWPTGAKGDSRRSERSGLHPSSFRTALYLSASAALALSSSVVHPFWAQSRYPTQRQGLMYK